nr:MAG TPA: hypothetical protein [Caudoviricetes sp.]
MAQSCVKVRQSCVELTNRKTPLFGFSGEG